MIYLSTIPYYAYLWTETSTLIYTFFMKNFFTTTSFLKYCLCIGILWSSSCKRKKSEEVLIFEDVQKSIPVVANCDSIPCGEIKLTYPQLFSKSPLQLKINKKIETTMAGLLLDDPHTMTYPLDEAIEKFRTSYDSLNERFPEDIAPYEATIDVALLETLSNRLNFVIDSYIYTSGAHGYEKVTYLMLSSATGEEIPFYRLLRDEQAFVQIAEEQFRRKFDIPSSASINSTGYMFENEKFTLPEQCIVLSKDIVLTYNPYEIAPYSEDPIELHIPVAMVEHLLQNSDNEL